MRITEAEHSQRVAAFAGRLEEAGLTGAVLFDSAYVLYYTGFAFVPTERPMALVIRADATCGLFVPRLELEHAEANALVNEVAHYPEYPSVEHPTVALAQLLERLEI